MNPDPLPPIPIPPVQRWRDLRLRWLPAITFFAVIATVALLWRDHVAAPTLVGQAEPVLANVSSYKAGLLAELNVTRFQKVKTGDPIGRIVVAEPRILESSLAVIRAEIELLRVNMSPIANQQRNAINYTQLQLDWMKQRAALASARVSLQLANIELVRTQELFNVRIASKRELDQADATFHGWEKQVQELTQLVSDVSRNLGTLQLTNAADIASVSSKPVETAIAVQESKLRLVEAELSPVTVRAPIDGIVSLVFHRSGESITAGQPIVAIATLHPVRIVGYLRPPIAREPVPGMSVKVRTRSHRRELGLARITQVGSQYEAIPDAVLGPLKMANVELALPVDISLPANLAIRPGELVDITLDPTPD